MIKRLLSFVWFQIFGIVIIVLSISPNAFCYFLNRLLILITMGKNSCKKIMWLKTHSVKWLVYLWNYWQRNTGTPVYILVHCTIMRVLMREDRKDELKVRKYPGIEVIVKSLIPDEQMHNWCWFKQIFTYMLSITAMFFNSMVVNRDFTHLKMQMKLFSVYIYINE